MSTNMNTTMQPPAQPGMYKYPPMHPPTDPTGMYMYPPMYPPTNNIGMYYMYPTMPVPAGPSKKVDEERPPRPDRPKCPNNKTAQGVLPPDACIFVGNLSTQVSIRELVDDLKGTFSSFGRCFVKIKHNKKNGLPGAFVQYEHAAHANAALAYHYNIKIHGRLLRIEKIKGNRTAYIGLRSGEPIDTYRALVALRGRGNIEHYHQEGDVYKVTFSYVDDCYDAVKYFEDNSTYWLTMADQPQEDK